MQAERARPTAPGQADRAEGTGQVNTGVRALLRLPRAYRLMQWFLGTRRARERVIAEHFRPVEGSSVLDLGCGPGSLLPALPPLRYVGIDLEPGYIEQARRDFGDRGEFHAGSAADLEAFAPESFDLVMANALLHHLDDATATRMIGGAHRVLRPGGRLVTLDNAWVPGQPWIARTLIGWDRGQHVRTPEGYRALVEPLFGPVRAVVRQDLLRIPYTLVILEAVKAPGAAAAPGILRT